MRHRRERSARLARGPARPPADVRLRRRPERREPAPEELRLCGRPIHAPRSRRRASAPSAPSGTGRSTHVPRGRPRTSATFHRELRQDARADALRRLPPASRRRDGASSPSMGTVFVRSDVNASPRASSSRIAASQARLSQDAGRFEIPLSRMNFSSRRVRARDRPRRCRLDDGDELARDDEERPAHAEHAHEAPLLVERALDVRGRDAGRPRDGPRGTRSPRRWSAGRPCSARPRGRARALGAGSAGGGETSRALRSSTPMRCTRR